MLLPGLAALVVAALVTFGLGKLLRAREEPFLASLAGIVIAALLSFIALAPIALFLPQSWGWIAAIAAVAALGEAVRVRFAYRAAESLKDLWGLLSFGMAPALFVIVLTLSELIGDPQAARPYIWFAAFVVANSLLAMIHGASIAAFVGANWPWWLTWSCSAMASAAFMLSERVDGAGWAIIAVTIVVLLGLAIAAWRRRSVASDERLSRLT
jgi:hypothetical protein